MFEFIQTKSWRVGWISLLMQEVIEVKHGQLARKLQVLAYVKSNMLATQIPWRLVSLIHPICKQRWKLKQAAKHCGNASLGGGFQIFLCSAPFREDFQFD